MRFAERLRSTPRLLLAMLCALAAPCLVAEARAQTISELLLEKARSSVRVSGSVGMRAEAFTSSAATSRRPPTSAQATASLNVAALGFSTDISLLLSTEGSSLRQNLNQIGLDTRWRFVRVAGGAIYPRLSDFSLSGPQVTGGLAELTPGPLWLTFAAGRAQRAVEGVASQPDLAIVAREGTYERWLYAARAGLGDPQGTHVHLVGLVARDDTTSIGTPGETRPQDNISLTSLAGVSFFRRRVRVAAEGTLSALNQDRTAERIGTDDLLDPDSTSIPSAFLPLARVVVDLFEPTFSTTLGYAGRVEGHVRLKWGGLQARYKRIGPGFRSLGVYALRDDRDEWRVQPRLRLARGKIDLNVQVSQARNNLSGQRAATLDRQQLGANLRAQVAPWLSVSVTAQQGENVNTTNIVGEAAQVRAQQTQRLQVSPTLTLQRGERVHTLTLAGGLQHFDSDAQAGGGFGAGDYETLTFSGAWLGQLTSRMGANVTVTALSNATTTSTNTVTSGSAGLTRSFLADALQSGLTLGFTRSATSFDLAQGPDAPETAPALSTRSVFTQLLATLTASYRVTQADQVRLNVRGTRTAGGARDFGDIRAQVSYARRF